MLVNVLIIEGSATCNLAEQALLATYDMKSHN